MVCMITPKPAEWRVPDYGRNAFEDQDHRDQVRELRNPGDKASREAGESLVPSLRQAGRNDRLGRSSRGWTDAGRYMQTGGGRTAPLDRTGRRIVIHLPELDGGKAASRLDEARNKQEMKVESTKDAG